MYRPRSIRVSTPTAKLKTLADLQAGLPTTARDAAGDRSDILLITVRAIRGGQIDREAIHGLDAEDADADDRYRVEADDLLMPARSTSLQVAVVPGDLAGAVFNATLIRIRCVGGRLAPALLKAYFDHPEGRAQVEAASQSGTHQMNVTVAALGEIDIPVPPLDQQAELAATLQSADRAYASGIEAARRRWVLAHDIIIRQMRGQQHRVGAPA